VTRTSPRWPRAWALLHAALPSALCFLLSALSSLLSLPSPSRLLRRRRSPSPLAIVSGTRPWLRRASRGTARRSRGARLSSDHPPRSAGPGTRRDRRSRFHLINSLTARIVFSAAQRCWDACSRPRPRRSIRRCTARIRRHAQRTRWSRSRRTSTRVTSSFLTPASCTSLTATSILCQVAHHLQQAPRRAASTAMETLTWSPRVTFAF
jgi:hypothetical protein